MRVKDHEAELRGLFIANGLNQELNFTSSKTKTSIEKQQGLLLQVMKALSSRWKVV